MNLDYKIVWIDDTPDWVDSVIDEVKEHLSDQGYDPQIERFVDKAGLDRCTAADIDLVIIDYNLPDENGDSLISKIREQGSFKEVVFYSQDRPTQDVIGSISGVYHCQRDAAVDVIQKVIDVTLRKVNDLGVVRGLVIAEAIDLEVRIESMMVNLFGESGELFRSRVLDKGWVDLAKKFQFLNGVIKDRVSQVEGEEKERLGTVREVLREFEKEVVDQRNILAHSKRVYSEGQIVLKGINSRTKEIAFDRAWLQSMRANLRKHKENLAQLEGLLCNE